MRQIFSIFKGEYYTLRDLERKSYRVFYAGAGLAGLGIVLTFIGFGWLTFIGVPLIALGAAIFFVAMVWMSRLQKEPVRTVYCPYCAGQNEVFLSRKEFACDICARRVAISPSGEVVGLDRREDEDDDYR